jgi:hypothetical protein
LQEPAARSPLLALRQELLSSSLLRSPREQVWALRPSHLLRLQAPPFSLCRQSSLAFARGLRELSR